MRDVGQATEAEISMREVRCDTKGASLQDEAHSWLVRLASGSATADDLDALNGWRGRSAEHRRAFAEAALLWNLLGEATRQVAPGERPTGTRTLMQRRAFVGGGLMAASLAGAAAVVHPPLGLWPSWSELAAEYRTQKGERRQIEIADTMAIQINTQTSINFHRADDGGAVRVDLIAGEAAFTSRKPRTQDIVVHAGSGRAQARDAAFNVRRDDNKVSVSCIRGDVLVTCDAGTSMLGPGQQIIFNESGMSQIAVVDPELVTAWQRGLLIFRDVPLSRVIEDVNRYRFGKIVIIDSRLGQRRIIANFRIDRIEDVVDFVAGVVQAPVRRLPGGIVLLG